MSRESKQKMSRQARVLAVMLLVIALGAMIALTGAWLFENKGLQTMTKVQFPYLKLYGKDTDTVSVELGEIDVRKAGEKRIPFRIVSKKGTNFILQLGYTTNLPLNYRIIEVTDWTDWETAEVSVQNTVSGKILNLDADTQIANQGKHETTYGTYTSVQKNAEPCYWQSGKITYGESEKKYILVVSWSKCDSQVKDKDTEMIYLTAGVPGGNNEGK